MTVRSILPALLISSAALATSPGPNAPTLGAGQVAPLPHPYDTNADARRAVDDALAQGRRDNRTVLIDFGGNWCPDCRMLAGVLEQPAMHDWLGRHAVLVQVDVGRFNRNMDIAERWHVKIHAVPSVLAIAPDGTLVNPNDLTALSNDRGMPAQAIADQIAVWESHNKVAG